VRDDGGPAFPDPGRAQSEKQRAKLGNPGMSIRDYFAAAALQAYLTCEPASICDDKGKPFDMPISAATFALIAYQQADAMIAEREKS
jgi:hypothetical protein